MPLGDGVLIQCSFQVQSTQPQFERLIYSLRGTHHNICIYQAERKQKLEVSQRCSAKFLSGYRKKCLHPPFFNWYLPFPEFVPSFCCFRMLDRAEGKQPKGKVRVPNPSLAWFPKPYHLTQYFLVEGTVFWCRKCTVGWPGEAPLVGTSYLFSLNSKKSIFWEKFLQSIGLSGGCQSLEHIILNVGLAYDLR